MVEGNIGAPVEVGQVGTAIPQESPWRTFIPKEGRYSASMQSSLRSACELTTLQGVDTSVLHQVEERMDWEKFNDLPLTSNEQLLNMFREAKYLLTRMWSSPSDVNCPAYPSPEEANIGASKVIQLLQPFFKA